MAETNGKWAETKPVTTEIALIASLVQNKIKEITKKTYTMFFPTEYREIANSLPWHLLIKVYVELNEFIHVMICVEYVSILEPLNILVDGVLQNRKEEDPLEPFTPNN